MKSCWDVRKAQLHLKEPALIALLAVAVGLSAGHVEAGAGVVVWDTCTHFGEAVDIRNRSGWKAVPSDLLQLEANPPKASSDPGYYGREYSFEGDAVVENGYLTAVFCSSKGKLDFYSKAVPGGKVVEFLPLQMQTTPVSIRRCGILRNTGDEAALEVSFTAAGGAHLSAIVSIGRSEIVEIKPAQGMRQIRLVSPIEHAVVPSFIGDDLIYGPGPYPSTDALCIPSESILLGLLKGQNSVLVITWPQGKQQIRLRLGGSEQGDRFIESVDFDNDGQSLYMAVLEAPGIWHRQELEPSYLEKDVVIDWKRPFAAKWITQLYEGETRTTFAFRESKGEIWRGVAGRYCYPVWFDGDRAFYHLSKKVPPRGESLVYFLEGKGAPLSVRTPVDILKATLGRQVCDGILDFAGQRLRTHHRRGADGIRRACTCGCTEAIEAVFKAGQEIDRSEYVTEAVEDMLYFVRRHIERIDEYRVFADETIKFLRVTARSSADLRPFLDSLEQTAQQILQEYDVQKENIKSLRYAEELARKTTALTRRKSPRNLPTCLEFSKEWRAMGGAQDGLLAEYHVIGRRLFQDAGYGCANRPGAVELAQEVRRRCRQCLRNPDGYEIWPDY